MRHAHRCTALLALCLCAGLLPACGGSGGGSSGSATYRIGGSVSGLTAVSGVVLEDNGGDALTVSANGSFTFPTPVTSGGTYDVTVETQPRGETCTVSNGQGAASAPVSVSVGCASIYAAGGNNVAALSVNAGPASTTACGSNGTSGSCQTFNIPLVSVTVCEPAPSTTCATIPDVLVDTGSSGLRLIASAVAAANPNMTLPTMTDPLNPANTIAECLPFADGYSWGSVVYATVTVARETSTLEPAGETTTASNTIPVQIINENTAQSASLPAPDPSCTDYGSPENTVDDFDANGVLGVGTFTQDCNVDGSDPCTMYANTDIYFSCPSSGQCTPTTLVEGDQVINPVATFPTDNNGVIVQLPTLSTSGAATVSGYLVFGIGTEANNALGSVTVLTADADGNFTTTFDGQQLPYSFIDSGSNGLYFPQPTPNLDTCGTSGNSALFYCPTATTTLSATNEGQNGTTSDVTFQVANLNALPGTSFALDDVGGIAPPIAGYGGYFDWGLPFFYGRTTYVAIQEMNAGGTDGPYYAY